MIAIDLSGKRLELLKEVLGTLSRVGLLADLIESTAQGFVIASQRAAALLGVSAVVQEVRVPDDIARAFTSLRRENVDAVILGPGPMLFNERARIGQLALTHKLPILVSVAEMLPYGTLMSYGQDFPEFFRRAVAYVDRILRGAKPGELPVEQPTRLKLTINTKAAQALGLTIPDTLLARADEVIE
jgi:putative ABC transport system substrate-binding protein